MRKLKQLRKNKQDNEENEGPFQVIHHYRLIYKSKRRSVLRKINLAKKQLCDFSVTYQSTTETSQQNSTIKE